MRVLAYCHYYASHVRAGSETFLHELLLPLVAAGHEVSAVVTEHIGAPFRVEFEGVTVYSVSDDATALALSESVKPDVVITHHSEEAKAAVLARNLGVPSINLIHNYLSFTDSQHFRDHTLYVYNSLCAQHKFSRHRKNNVVINPVVRAAKHRPAALGDSITQVSLSKDKGVDTFAALADRLPDRDFLGVTGGHGTQEYPYFPNVRYRGPTQNMRGDVWTHTRVFVFPTHSESWGMAGIEAMSAGIPVIAHPTPGVLESHGFGAWYADYDDYDEWERLIRLLDDPVIWKQQSDKALAQAERLNPTNQLRLWVDLVQEMSCVGRDAFPARWAKDGPAKFGPILGCQRLDSVR